MSPFFFLTGTILETHLECRTGKTILAFNNLLSSCHPTICKFIEAIQKEQSLNEMKLNQCIEGVVESSRKRKRDTIKQLIDDHENRDKLEYLRGIAYNLSYQI